MAVEAGADAVLPKPMSRAHFLKLIVQAINRETELKPIPAAVVALIPEFAILDDSRLTLRAWKRKIGSNAIVYTFESPKEFWTRVQENPDFLDRLSFVLTDFYFAEGVLENGFGFAEELRKHFQKPILLCSDGEFTPDLIKGKVSGIVSKDPIPWDELHAIVNKSF